MNSFQIPSGAVCFSATPVFPEYQPAVLKAIYDEIATANRNAADLYARAAADWQQANLRNRSMGLALTPKPVAPNAQEVKSYVDQKGDLYVWEAVGTPLGVCPDLPPAPVTLPAIPAPAHVLDVPANDTTPVGQVITAPDGSQWQKQSSPTPFGVAVFYARIS